jgi:hypothetical protein
VVTVVTVDGLAVVAVVVDLLPPVIMPGQAVADTVLTD